MRHSRQLLLIAILACPGLAGAQNPTAPQPAARAPGDPVSEKDALKTFDADERTAIAAIKNDPNLTPIKKKEQIADLKKDDKLRRLALRDKYADKREAIHDVVRTHSADERQEQRERSERAGRR